MGKEREAPERESRPRTSDSGPRDPWLKLQRLLSLVPFGSLWWVKEQLWTERIPGYTPGRDRNEHPGLAIQRDLGFSALEPAVPMLHGTSQRHRRDFFLEGLSSDTSKTAYFGHLRPARFGLSEFERGEAIRPNRFKPCLNREEMRRLDDFLDNTGIMK